MNSFFNVILEFFNTEIHKKHITCVLVNAKPDYNCMTYNEVLLIKGITRTILPKRRVLKVQLPFERVIDA